MPHETLVTHNELHCSTCGTMNPARWVIDVETGIMYCQGCHATRFESWPNSQPRDLPGAYAVVCMHVQARWQWEGTWRNYLLACLACHKVLRDFGPPGTYDGGTQLVLDRPPFQEDMVRGQPGFVPRVYTQRDYDAVWQSYHNVPRPLCGTSAPPWDMYTSPKTHSMQYPTTR